MKKIYKEKNSQFTQYYIESHTYTELFICFGAGAYKEAWSYIGYNLAIKIETAITPYLYKRFGTNRKKFNDGIKDIF